MVHVYRPIGRCIYCDSIELPLTKEHIVPYGLGGDRILPKASCEDCRERTRKVEEFCLRMILGNTRITMGIQTRRPKERPTHLPVTLKLPDGTEKPILVPAGEFPITLALPYFEPAAALRNYPIVKPGPQKSGVWHFAPNEPELIKFLAKHGANSIGIGQFEPLTFARMLAKIAHGFAAAELGVDAFSPTTRSLIRGEDTDMNRFVGAGIGDDLAADQLHRLQYYTHKETGDVAVTIRLFASLSAPIYHVLVGRLKG